MPVRIGIHPRALLELDDQEPAVKEQIEALVDAYAGPREFFVQRVSEGISMLAAAFAPEPVIVRMSDFKSNEYAGMLGGARYEPAEENPMLGYRGAARYLSDDFAACFAMECEALKYVRDEMGLTNVKVMIPFVRTVAEAEGVIDLLASPCRRFESCRGHETSNGLEHTRSVVQDPCSFVTTAEVTGASNDVRAPTGERDEQHNCL